eukprot:CAMPEP_0117649760 /NCGR_PEP_ID=MMETSP0804-20121206/1164_1 /TAXON_ID=1074897 /ORGANISM="Tetraselmis astigmatica, Strain CCMP880" /LENGTH=53 /DNA_ID=CAMNT_0005455559 /DNA_START=193 /DNA_END=351 /DNA_ORIENTATION=-
MNPGVKNTGVICTRVRCPPFALRQVLVDGNGCAPGGSRTLRAADGWSLKSCCS